MPDILANRAANDYAEYLLTSEENEQALNDILAKHIEKLIEARSQ